MSFFALLILGFGSICILIVSLISLYIYYKEYVFLKSGVIQRSRYEKVLYDIKLLQEKIRDIGDTKGKLEVDILILEETNGVLHKQGITREEEFISTYRGMEQLYDEKINSINVDLATVQKKLDIANTMLKLSLRDFNPKTLLDSLNILILDFFEKRIHIFLTGAKIEINANPVKLFNDEEINLLSEQIVLDVFNSLSKEYIEEVFHLVFNPNYFDKLVIEKVYTTILSFARTYNKQSVMDGKNPSGELTPYLRGVMESSTNTNTQQVSEPKKTKKK